MRPHWPASPHGDRMTRTSDKNLSQRGSRNIMSAVLATVRTEPSTIDEPAAAATGATPLLQPAVMVIFGATGDLTARKLMPALFGLHQGQYMPPELVIVGVGRRAKTDDQFRADVQQALTKFRARRGRAARRRETVPRTGSSTTAAISASPGSGRTQDARGSAGEGARTCPAIGCSIWRPTRSSLLRSSMPFRRPA